MDYVLRLSFHQVDDVMGFAFLITLLTLDGLDVQFREVFFWQGSLWVHGMFDVQFREFGRRGFRFLLHQNRGLGLGGRQSIYGLNQIFIRGIILNGNAVQGVLLKMMKRL